MPNNKSVNDLKPNSLISDIKPVNNQAADLKPNNLVMSDVMQVYTETRTIQAGQTMGLLLALTYPTAGTFTNATRL